MTKKRFDEELDNLLEYPKVKFIEDMKALTTIVLIGIVVCLIVWLMMG